MKRSRLLCLNYEPPLARGINVQLYDPRLAQRRLLLEIC
jgi:hypothetical protein